MVDGRWSMVDGRWSMVDGRWSMVDGRWSMVIRKLYHVPRKIQGKIWWKLEASAEWCNIYSVQCFLQINLTTNVYFLLGEIKIFGGSTPMWPFPKNRTGLFLLFVWLRNGIRFWWKRLVENEEGWQSGRLRRSWKPLNRKVSRVRIPLLPPGKYLLYAVEKSFNLGR